MNVWDYICKLTARIAALQAALREQYELAHGGLPADHDESSCDDRCRRARQLIEEPQP